MTRTMPRFDLVHLFAAAVCLTLAGADQAQVTRDEAYLVRDFAKRSTRAR